jgi:hypothetical protein
MGAMDEITEMINKVDETTKKNEWNKRNHKNRWVEKTTELI